MTKPNKNILISGTMRSGTTLMCATLDAHPEISLISDILNWFWSKFYPVYGDIQTEYELEKALYELEYFIIYGLNKEQKEKIYNDELKKSIIKKGISSNNFYFSLIEMFYYEDVKNNIGIKATHQAKYYNYFLENLPDSYIIHMTRNVLDIYNSHKKRVRKEKYMDIIKKDIINIKNNFGKLFIDERYYEMGLRMFSPYVYSFPIKMFDEWVIENEQALAVQKKYPDRVIIVKYEDFVSNVEGVLKKIMDFLSIQWIDGFYEYKKLKDRNGMPFKANTSSLKKITGGFSTESINVGERKITVEEMKYFKKIAKKTAENLGYNFKNFE